MVYVWRSTATLHSRNYSVVSTGFISLDDANGISSSLGLTIMGDVDVYGMG